MNAQAAGILDPPPAADQPPPGRVLRFLRDLKDGLKVWKYGAKEWSAYTVGNNIADAKWLGIVWLINGKEAPALIALAMEKVALFTKVFVTTTIGLMFNSN
jgi:hypothetical protein